MKDAAGERRGTCEDVCEMDRSAVRRRDRICLWRAEVGLAGVVTRTGISNQHKKDLFHHFGCPGGDSSVPRGLIWVIFETCLRGNLAEGSGVSSAPDLGLCPSPWGSLARVRPVLWLHTPGEHAPSPPHPPPDLSRRNTSYIKAILAS